MKQLLFAALLLIAGCTETEQQGKQPIDWVNPQIGATHCRWFFYTPAALPFGMAKLAPTTDAFGSPGSWLPNGYDDRHTSIEGFAHLHEFQIGGIVAIPTVGALKTVPGTQENPDSGYRSRFDKTSEKSAPGTYEVTLKDYNVKVELTATERVGYHRYTFPQSDSSRILFDIGHPQGESAEVVGTSIDYDPTTNRISGYVECYPVYATFCDKENTVKSYFVAQLNKKPTHVGTFRDSLAMPNTTHIDGIGTGIYAEFPTTEGEIVEMQVGLSYTSVANAVLNLETETHENSFDNTALLAHKKWNEMLGRIEVEGKNDADITKFYTALYHALLGRGLASDVNGCYITNTKQIAQPEMNENGTPKHHHYNTDGIWGAFWNLTQVWTLAYPEYFDDYVHSTLNFSRHTGGWLHDGEAAGVYTNGVQTNFQGLIACAAYNAGIIKDDIDYLWKAVYQNETGYENRPAGAGRYDNIHFVKKGYIPSIDYKMENGWTSNFGVSHTLEYTFGAYAASSLAKQLGKTAEADTLRRLAESYRLLFDPETGYMRPREMDGTFIKDFDPMQAWYGFQEGNAVQYTWYVPHDVAGLIELVGKERFNQRLEQTFADAQSTLYGGKPGEFDSFSGVEKLYNHGNQPCLHNSWLFNYSGKPWLTQYYTRDICNTFYGTEPTHGYGWGQDEDQGQLGAWYVMASIGLFDVQGGTNTSPTMQLGSPTFDKVTIHLSDNYYKGKTFVIETKNNSDSTVYIQNATINNENLEQCFIPLSSITDGGTLTLTMGAKPNESWGSQTPPPSMSTEN